MQYFENLEFFYSNNNMYYVAEVNLLCGTVRSQVGNGDLSSYIRIIQSIYVITFEHSEASRNLT